MTNKALGVAGGTMTGLDDSTILGAISGGTQGKVGPQTSQMEQYWWMYAKHPWVSTCVSLIAEAVASESFSVKPTDGQGAGDVDPTDDDARAADIYSFFEHSTPNSTFASLRLATAVDLRVFGLAYWRKKRAATEGLPLFLERLDPRRITVKLNPQRDAIVSFLMRKGTKDETLDINIPPEVIPAKDVIFFRMSGGDVLFGPPAPLEALDMTIAQDWSIRKHREAFFRNGGVSGRIIQIEGATEDQAQAITKRLRANKMGTEAAFQDLVLPGLGITVIEGSASQGKTDFDFSKGSAQLRDEIFAVFKVPPGKVFINSGALGSAGKSVDDDTFQKDAVLPVERVIYETLTMDILKGEFDIHDLRLVPSRMSAIRLDMFQAAENLTHFGGTGNEARELVNLPPINDPRFDLDVPLFTSGKQPVVDEEATDGDLADKDGEVTDVDEQTSEENTGKKKPNVKKAKGNYRNPDFRKPFKHAGF